MLHQRGQRSVVLLNEAFINFWGDALLDPISAKCPKFVICKLKPNAKFEMGADDTLPGCREEV